MIEVSHLHKTFNPGTVNEMTLFDDFNLVIEKNSFVSIVGSNGSGKTTLLNIICGSLAADRGDILMDDILINKLPEYQRSSFIARVFQDPSMGTCPSMTILENLSLADRKGKSFGLRPGVNKTRIDDYRAMLSRLGLGLENKLDSQVGALSGGQRQALALLMATMSDLHFLILDEHTAALDPKTADVIMELTDKVVREKEMTTIMVTHNLRYAVDYGDRMIMMHQGNIVLDRDGKEKEQTKVDDLLDLFNEISIECGN